MNKVVAIACVLLFGCGDAHTPTETTQFQSLEACIDVSPLLDTPAKQQYPATASPTRPIVEPITCPLDRDAWGMAESGGIVNITTDAARVSVPLLVEPGETLAGVEVIWIGAGGHAATPAGMPDVTIWRSDLEGVAVDSIGYGVDELSDRVAYQSAHSITVFCDPDLVDVERFRYHAVIRGEYGEGAIPGAVLLGVRRLVVDE